MRNFAAFAAARSTLETVVTSLLPIRVAPLKGVLLHAVAYPDPSERRLSDVDVLVHPGSANLAVGVLTRAGWRVGSASWPTWTMHHEDHVLPLDLHAGMFRYGLFQMPSEDVLRRARPDARLFGCEVLLPDPYDVYAHLVGHFVKDRMTAADSDHLLDFERVPLAFALEPLRAAKHLRALGLRRAGLCALTVAQDSFSGQVCEFLTDGSVDGIVQKAVRLGRGLPQPAFAPHLFDASAASGLRSLAIHALSAIRGR